MIWLPVSHTAPPLLIDVDTQGHFFRSKGPICVHDPRRVLANVRRVVRWAQRRHIPMMSTIQVHPSYDDYRLTAAPCRLTLEKPNGTLAKRRLTLESSDRLDFSNETWQHYDQIIVHKRTFDPFEEPRADRILTNLPTNTCILMGTALEGAVKATALGLLLRQKQVIVVADAVGTVNRSQYQDTLEHLQSKNVRLISTAELIEQTRTVAAKTVH